MASKVNLKSIANDLNLSPSTVSRVLNGKAKEFRISDDTVENVLKYVKLKEYSPNLVAKGLQSSKTFTLGFIIPDISNPFFALLARNIGKAASKQNYSLLLADAEQNIEQEQKQIRNLIDRKVDGIIAVPIGTSFKYYQNIIDLDIPLVFVDRYFKDSRVPYISSDNYMGGYQATKHIIEKGHKKIGLIKGNNLIETVNERERGYLGALHEAGIDKQVEFIAENLDFSIENGYKSAKKMFQQANMPTAIFALSNLMGLGVLQAIKEFGLRIPDDISLLIFDDQPYVSYLNPPVTTIKQDSEKIGELAINYIIKKIERNDIKLKPQLIATKLIIRSSIGQI